MLEQQLRAADVVFRAGNMQGTAAASITGIDCVEQVDGSADLYANLQFGAGGDDSGPPVPASGTWGMIARLGLLMVGSLFFMRRRAEA